MIHSKALCSLENIQSFLPIDFLFASLMVFGLMVKILWLHSIVVNNGV